MVATRLAAGLVLTFRFLEALGRRVEGRSRDHTAAVCSSHSGVQPMLVSGIDLLIPPKSSLRKIIGLKTESSYFILLKKQLESTG